METWKKVWREGVAPELSTGRLQVLLRGLEKDDARLIQGVTTTPPPMQCVLDWPCEAGCLIVYPFAFEGADPKTVGEAEEFFAKVCFEADQRLGEPAAVRYLLNAFDDWPRVQMLSELATEVRRELASRGVQ